MLKEFKAFAMRGNVIDLAVGLVIGIAFGAVVNSFVADLLTPLIAAIGGQPDFATLILSIGDGDLKYGLFLNALINFVIVAFALFMIVRFVNKMTRPKGASDEPPTTRECPFCMTGIPTEATRCSACTSEVEPVAA